MSFENIIGQPLPLSIIQNGLKSNTLSQSLLFHGPSSSGKLTLAIALAKALNCEKNDNNYCDNCSSCRKINSFLHPDVFIINTDDIISKLRILKQVFNKSLSGKHLSKLIYLIDDVFYRYSSQFFAFKGTVKTTKKAQTQLHETISEYKLLLKPVRTQEKIKKISPSEVKQIDKIVEASISLAESLILDNIPIETIRQLTKKLYVKPLEGKSKVFIINGMEFMREEGANTFLKSIEEPPPNNLLILITENMERILPTIKSRCFTIPFKALSFSSQEFIIKEHFAMGIEESGTRSDKIWDYLQSEEEKHKAQSLADEFFNNTIHNYRQGNTLFKFVDKLIDSGEYQSFMMKIIDTLSEIKMMKYGIKELEEDKKKFVRQPDIKLNEIVKEGESLLQRIDTFNLNPNIALTGYLMKIAQSIH